MSTSFHLRACFLSYLKIASARLSGSRCALIGGLIALVALATAFHLAHSSAAVAHLTRRARKRRIRNADALIGRAHLALVARGRNLTVNRS